jgi:hypothetical protein
MEAICSSETSIDYHRTTRHCISEHINLHSHLRENPKSNVRAHSLGLRMCVQNALYAQYKAWGVVSPGWKLSVAQSWFPYLLSLFGFRLKSFLGRRRINRTDKHLKLCCWKKMLSRTKKLISFLRLQSWATPVDRALSTFRLVYNVCFVALFDLSHRVTAKPLSVSKILLSILSHVHARWNLMLERGSLSPINARE